MSRLASRLRQTAVVTRNPAVGATGVTAVGSGAATSPQAASIMGWSSIQQFDMATLTSLFEIFIDGVEPELGDIVTINGVVYTTRQIKPYQLGRGHEIRQVLLEKRT